MMNKPFAFVVGAAALVAGALLFNDQMTSVPTNTAQPEAPKAPPVTPAAPSEPQTPVAAITTSPVVSAAALSVKPAATPKPASAQLNLSLPKTVASNTAAIDVAATQTQRLPNMFGDKAGSSRSVGGGLLTKENEEDEVQVVGAEVSFEMKVD